MQEIDNNIESNNQNNASEISVGETNNGQTSWLSNISEDLRSNDSLTRFKNIDALAKSYLEAQKSLNTRISVPDDKASEEDMGKFYDKLGRPADKKYLVENRKKDDEKIITLYEDLFYHNGLSRKQGEVVLAKMYELQEQDNNKHKEEFAKLKDTNICFLSDRYKDKFDEKMKIGLSALDKYGSKELAELIEESNYHPALVDMLVKVGEMIRPDSIIASNDPASNYDSPEGALKEIKKLESDNDFMLKYRNKKHVGHDGAIAQLNDLYALAYKK